MPYQESEISGAFLFTPWVYQDSRGSFHESFRSDQTKAQTGIDFATAQINSSTSHKGALRGIHFKQDPPGQRKFVTVSHGSIFDVIVDLRKSSPTFGKWLGFEMSAGNHKALLLNNGIGHGFLALEQDTVVSYLVDTVYEADFEHTINPLSLGIDWGSQSKESGITEFLLSDRDAAAPDFANAQHLLFD